MKTIALAYGFLFGILFALLFLIYIYDVIKEKKKKSQITFKSTKGRNFYPLTKGEFLETLREFNEIEVFIPNPKINHPLIKLLNCKSIKIKKREVFSYHYQKNLIIIANIDSDKVWPIIKGHLEDQKREIPQIIELWEIEHTNNEYYKIKRIYL